MKKYIFFIMWVAWAISMFISINDLNIPVFIRNIFVAGLIILLSRKEKNNGKQK